MARKSTKATEVVNEKVETTNTPSVEDLMKIIGNLQQQISEMQNNKDVEPAAAAPKATKTNKDDKRKVTLTNLSADNLFLRDSNNSHNLKPFESAKISQKQATQVYENWPQGLATGIYTMSDWFLEQEDIEVLDNIETDVKKIQAVIKMDPADAEQIFRALPPEQRGSVISLIQHNIMNGVSGSNIATCYHLGELCGKNFKELEYRMGV